jgi:DNA-binding MarR family transcriptional regulator
MIPTRIISGGMPHGEPARPPELPIDSPDRRRLPPLLRTCWYSLNQAFRRRIFHTGVTPDQFTVMRTLLEGSTKGISQRDLVELMSSDPNTVASLLERMEANGLVERRPHETDRRARRIKLLPRGKRLYQTIRAIAIELQTEVLAVLPEGERDRFLSQLSLVADSCRVAAEGSVRKKKG